MAHLACQPGRSRPDHCGIYHADVFSGTYAFGAIASALYQRSVTGQGQQIDVSMMESMLSLTLVEVQYAQLQAAPPSRPVFGPTETTDGYVILTVASEKTFQGLMKAIGHPEWITDPRFARFEDRRANWSELIQGIESWSRTVSTQECIAAFNAGGVPASAYRTVAEAMRDPQIAHRRALSEVEDAGGTFRVLNVPFRMSGADVKPAAGQMAALGEHTRALLQESGLSDEQLASFSSEAANVAQGG
jgi:crotonobetainyl-CoA:carnitine CoA-transferase CaiB-like acyl-CoA transferase